MKNIQYYHVVHGIMMFGWQMIYTLWNVESKHSPTDAFDHTRIRERVVYGVILPGWLPAKDTLAN